MGQDIKGKGAVAKGEDVKTPELQASSKLIKYDKNLEKRATIEGLMGNEFWYEDTWAQADPLKVHIPGYIDKLDAHMKKRGYKRDE